MCRAGPCRPSPRLLTAQEESSGYPILDSDGEDDHFARAVDRAAEGQAASAASVKRIKQMIRARVNFENFCVPFTRFCVHFGRTRVPLRAASRIFYITVA